MCLYLDNDDSGQSFQRGYHLRIAVHINTSLPGEQVDAFLNACLTFTIIQMHQQFVSLIDILMEEIKICKWNSRISGKQKLYIQLTSHCDRQSARSLEICVFPFFFTRKKSKLRNKDMARSIKSWMLICWI